MLSDLAGAVISFVATSVRNLVVDIFLFYVGRGALLACTLGRYPHGRALERDAGRIAAAGLGSVVLTGVALAVYNNVLAFT
ncbi:MAG: hypothetical protein ACTHK2_02100 [Dokdonella sp.]|uniref:hypothetical protein n=1 Tax=Dokdonella sp. TaxID=2291710 RepID=UPI003F7F0D56